MPKQVKNRPRRTLTCFPLVEPLEDRCLFQVGSWTTPLIHSLSAVVAPGTGPSSAAPLPITLAFQGPEDQTAGPRAGNVGEDSGFVPEAFPNLHNGGQRVEEASENPIALPNTAAMDTGPTQVSLLQPFAVERGTGGIQPRFSDGDASQPWQGLPGPDFSAAPTFPLFFGIGERPWNPNSENPLFEGLTSLEGETVPPEYLSLRLSAQGAMLDSNPPGPPSFLGRSPFSSGNVNFSSPDGSIGDGRDGLRLPFHGADVHFSLDHVSEDNPNTSPFSPVRSDRDAFPARSVSSDVSLPSPLDAAPIETIFAGRNPGLQRSPFEALNAGLSGGSATQLSGDSSSREGRNKTNVGGDRQGSDRMTRPGQNGSFPGTEETRVPDKVSAVPQEEGLLMGGIAFSAAALENAIQSLMEPILAVEGRVADILYWMGFSSWLLAAGLALEAARRWNRRRFVPGLCSLRKPTDLRPEMDP